MDRSTTIIAKQILIQGKWLANQEITLNDGVISHIQSISFDEITDHHDAYENIILSYIDVQVNGGGGELFTQQVTPDQIEYVAKVHQRFGTGAMLPTLITNDIQAMQHMANAVAHCVNEPASDVDILGVHFEGPWLASAKKGIHLDRFIRAPSDAELACVLRQDLGKVRVTLAPETVPVDIIRELVAQGVIVSLGHTNADADTTLAALEAGASGFTHLFNAMSGFSGREPGVLGAALSHHGSFAGLIMDGQHVSPISIQAALNAKGIEHSVLVTDAMGHVGSDNLTQPYFDLSITRNGKQLTTPDGSLAGSCLTMHEAVLNTVQHCNVTMQEAIVMATQSPANWLGVADRGRIEVGQQANLIALTPSNTSHRWQISAHWIKGHKLHA